jgi:hypothetical protein
MTMSTPERRGLIQAHPPELRERGYKLFSQRMALASIADALDVPVDTIRKWSSKGKWKARRDALGPRNSAAAALPTAAEIEGGLAKLMDLTFPEKQQAYKDIMAIQSLRMALSIQNIPSAALVQNADKVKKLDETARTALGLEKSMPAIVVNVGLLAQAAQPARRLERVIPPSETPAVMQIVDTTER